MYEFEEKTKQAFSISLGGGKKGGSNKLIREEKGLKEGGEGKGNYKSEVPEEFVKVRSEDVIVMSDNWQ